MAKTKHNTGLTLSRNGEKFTAKWVIKAKDVTDQDIRWRRHNGTKWLSWHKKDLGKSTKEYSFKIEDSLKTTKVQVQTKTKAKDHKASDYSDSSYTYTVSAPPDPSLSVTNDASNKTTFKITSNASATSKAWVYKTYYRTRLGSGNWTAWAVASSSSIPYTDNNSNGLTRSMEIKNKGPAGESKVKSAHHYLGAPPIATWGSVSRTNRASYYQMTYSVGLKGSTLLVDKIVPQYYIGTPTSSIGVPNGVSWQDGTDFLYKNGTDKYVLSINTADLVEADECMWARVKTEHDGIPSYSGAYRVLIGAMTAPTCSITVGTISSSGFSVTVDVTDAGTDVPGAYQRVYLEKASAPGIANYIYIGSVPNGDTSVTFTSALDITSESGFGIHVQNVSADGKTMKSGFYTYKMTMPAAPTLNGVTPTTTAGKVHVDWTTNWSAATGAEIAWTDDRDNWTSNDEPETYEVKENATGWFITGLETGKVWYFRVRSVKTEDDQTNCSSWSEEVAIDLASAPAIPILYLSEESITEDGMVTAYWSYITTDGTGQIAAEVVEATNNNGVWTYSDTPLGSTTDAQHVDIYAADQSTWQDGATVYLALRTRSGSGGMSDYSTPVRLVIAGKPTASITATDLVGTNSMTQAFRGDGETTEYVCEYNLSSAPTVTVEGETVSVTYQGDTVTFGTAPADGDEISITYTTTDFNAMTDLPFNVTVATTNAETVSLAIERALDYPLLRPDEETTEGPEGETVYVETISAEATNSFSISLDDLIGRLDDGAKYRLVATATDEFGQEAEDSIDFVVKWAHQAEEPTATFITDADNYIARITPIAPSNFEAGDTCDIYRLSSDKPELIYQGATFGTEYVDPYPAFGVNSGYKLVTVTATGDYITPDNSFAELDTTLSDPPIYTQLDPKTIVIDFGGNSVELPYNITLGNSWSKDFQRTSYLGGSVVGDHNKAVLRDLSADTVLARDLDEATAVQMRALARYAGTCHVRTPEGSSFAADVQISEDRGYDTALISYSINIQKVDSVGFDGMTYADWLKGQETP